MPRYNPPPNWPQPPQGWTPPVGWTPDPSWGPAPDGWQVWLEDYPPSAPQGFAPPPRPSVAYVPVQTNHVFHLLMTLITCGIWGLLVWLPMVVINQWRKNKVVTKSY